MVKRLIGLALLMIALALLADDAVALTAARAEALIAQVRSQGFLSARVRVRAPTASERDIGLAMKIEDDFSCTLIVAPLRGDSLIPADRRGDPLVDEFIALHELAHCEHMQLPALFRSRHASQRENDAYHDIVLLGSWLEAVALFKEMFADTYAAAMLLARHHRSAKALALVRDFARWRRDKTLATFRVARVHATTPALEALLEERRFAASPAPMEVRSLALETASDAFVASLPDHTFADQIALTDRGTVDAARYVGWMWRAAAGLSAPRTFEHHEMVAARLAHPMPDLLERMRAFVQRRPTADATREFVNALEVTVDDRIRARIEVAEDLGR